MKQYTKNWLLAFTISIMTTTIFALAFLLWAIPRTADNEIATPQTEPEPTKEPSEPYYNAGDNVGAVSFTEDMVTELARNIYSLDGFVSNLHVDFEDSGGIRFSAAVKDPSKMLEEYPELTPYKPVVAALQDKQITVNCTLEDSDGTAKLKVESADIEGVKLPESIIAPVVEMSDFSKLFDVSFDSIEITNDQLIFHNGVPAILQY